MKYNDKNGKDDVTEVVGLSLTYIQLRAYIQALE